MGMLKKAGLVEVRPGIAGAELAKELSNITLLDVYRAVNVVKEKELFSIHKIQILIVPWEEIFKVQLNLFLRLPKQLWKKL